MSTITKEQAQSVSDLKAGYTLGHADVAILNELARIALASLEAEHAGFIVKHKVTGKFGSWLHSKADWFRSDEYEVLSAYTAPPVSVSEREPAQMFGIGSVFKPQILSGDEVDCDNCAHYQPNVCHGEGCPAAMLQGADGNSPVIPDGWVACSEWMPNDKDYVWCWGRVVGWTEDDGFEAYYDATRNKWWAVIMDGEEPVRKVTHWQPLPSPPFK